MASVRKRTWTHNGQAREAWVVAYTDQGGKRRLKTFDKKKDADRHRVKVEGEIERGEHVPDRGTTTLEAAAEAWLLEQERRVLMADGLTKGSFLNCHGHLKRYVLPALGGVLLTNLTSEAVRDFLARERLSRAFASVKSTRQILCAVLNFAVRKGFLQRNVIEIGGVRTPGEAKRIAIPDHDTIRRLLAQTADRGHKECGWIWRQRRAMVALALYCGLRRGEIAGLQWQFVRFDLEQIQVRHSLSPTDGLKAPKTEGSVRDVYMAAPVREALEAVHRIMGYPEAGYVFLSREGHPHGPIGLWRNLWYPLLIRAGLVDATKRPLFHLHALRHVNVSLLIAANVPALHISRHVGHSKVTTTLNTYGHLFPGDERVTNALRDMATDFHATSERQEVVRP